MPAQQKFHESDKKFRGYIGGIGAGKTFAGCMESMWYRSIPKAGSLEVIVAPTFPRLRDAIMRTFFDICPRELIDSWNKNTYTLKLVNGSELATSSTILELFNTTYAGIRRDYEKVADELIMAKFEGTGWSYEIPTKDSRTETGTFTFEEMECKFKLDTIDVTDQLQEAQARLANTNVLQGIKTIGAGKSDSQALGDEYGFGVLDLDNFDNVHDGQGMPFAVEIRGPCVLLARKISNPLILNTKNLQQLS